MIVRFLKLISLNIVFVSIGIWVGYYFGVRDHWIFDSGPRAGLKKIQIQMIDLNLSLRLRQALELEMANDVAIYRALVNSPFQLWRCKTFHDEDCDKRQYSPVKDTDDEQLDK